jgi:o-succinylbenzoate---CoA ligase
MVVEGWLHRAARTRPESTAVEGPEGGRSYTELYAAAQRGAGVLSAQGVAPGDRVAIALPPGLEFVEAFHACLLLGAVAVPVDLRLAQAERALICDGAVLIVQGGLTQGPSATQRPSAHAPGRSGHAGVPGPGHDLRQGHHHEREHDLDAVAAVIHTSGTTSAPRPVELTYGNFLWSALGSAVALDRDPAERWLCALPVSHVGGLSILVRSAIYATTAVIHPRFDTDLVMRALYEQNITLISLVATTLARLLDAMPAHPEHPPALRCALTGGGPVPEALVERAHDAGVRVSTTYGLTEACSQVTTGGPPLFCTRVRIGSIDGIDGSSSKERQSQQQVGEILVCGPTVAPGSRDPDGWLHTGDLGSLDERGFLQVTGRVADTIISGGENVAPAEVEAVLEAHPDVLEAAVLGRSDPSWGEAIAAIVVPRTGCELTVEELCEHCAERLARYKVPKRVDFTGTPLPRTPSGKLLRRELK